MESPLTRHQAPPPTNVPRDDAGSPGRRYRRPPFALRELILDALMLLAAALAGILSAPASELPEPDPGSLLVFSLLTLFLLGSFGMYEPRFAPHFLDDLRRIIAATAIAAMALTFVRVLAGDDPHAAGKAVRVWLFAAVYLAAARGGLQLTQARSRRRGTGGERTLIIGAGEVGRLAARRFLERPEFGLRPVAFLDHDPLHSEENLGLPVLGQEIVDRDDPAAFTGALDRIVRELDVRHVVVAFSRSSHDVDLTLVRRCQELGVSVSLVPRLFGGLPDQTELERLGGLPLITVRPADPRGWQVAVKYAVDRVAAVLAVVVLLPLLAAIALAILISMGRPILFRQPRVGMDGREFEILKFRTMRQPRAEEPGASAGDLEPGLAPGGVEGADRRTGLGAFLRRYSLDELAQLFNVLHGEMSLIGPRPERPDFAREFDRRVHRYVDRSRVKSGLTGWAQVQGLRGKTSVADRAEWDNYYIENWSPWLDLKILLMTFVAVIRRPAE